MWSLLLFCCMYVCTVYVRCSIHLWWALCCCLLYVSPYVSDGWRPVLPSVEHSFECVDANYAWDMNIDLARIIQTCRSYSTFVQIFWNEKQKRAYYFPMFEFCLFNSQYKISTYFWEAFVKWILISSVDFHSNVHLLCDLFSSNQ